MTRAVQSVLALLAIGAATALAVVLRAVGPTDLADAGIGWVIPILGASITAAAALATLACVMAGVRDGSLDALLRAGASAALAAGALGLATSGSSLAPAVAGAAGFALAAGVADRRGTLVHGRGRRLLAVTGVVAIAGAAAAAGIAPASAEALAPYWTAILAGSAAVAGVAALVGGGRASTAAAGAILVGAVALSLANSTDATAVLGLVALLCGSLLTAHDTLGVRHAPLAPGDVGSLPSLADHVGDAVLRFDGRLQLRSWNPAAARVLMLDDAAAGTRLEDIFGVPLDRLSGPGPQNAATLAGGMEVSLHREDGGVTAVLRSVGSPDHADRLGRELRGTLEELLHARRTVDLQRVELERAATTDALTAVASRTAILARLDVEVAEARRYQHPVAIVLIDVDHLADINAAHGTLGGDAILREVALRMRLRVRSADSLGRHGGDTFLAILPHTDEGGAATFADALRRRVADRPITIDGVEVAVTLSGGVAVMRPAEELDRDGLLSRAEEALTSARGSGGNRVALDRLHGFARLGPRPAALEVTDDDATAEGT